MRKLLLCLPLVSAAAAAQTYCALEVKVKSPDGRALPRVGVVLTRDQRTTAAETETSENGTARFCDIPFGPVDVVVGNAGCGQVSIRRVDTHWPHTSRVQVVYDDSYCVSGLHAMTCQIQIRVVDETGKPLPHVRFHTAPGVGGALRSDEYGRIFAVAQRPQTVTGRLELAGREAVPVTYSCGDYFAETITMRSVAKGPAAGDGSGLK